MGTGADTRKCPRRESSGRSWYFRSERQISRSGFRHPSVLFSIHCGTIHNLPSYSITDTDDVFASFDGKDSFIDAHRIRC
jgi:hypothetical protein